MRFWFSKDFNEDKSLPDPNDKEIYEKDAETQINSEAQVSEDSYENDSKKEITVGQYMFLIGYAIVFLLIGWFICYWIQSERLAAKDREIARLRNQYNLAVDEKDMITDVSETIQLLENAESPTVELIAQVDIQNTINIMVEDIHHLSNQILREQDFIRGMGKILSKEKDEGIRSYLIGIILTHRDIMNAYKAQRDSYLSGLEKITKVPEQVKNFKF